MSRPNNKKSESFLKKYRIQTLNTRLQIITWVICALFGLVILIVLLSFNYVAKLSSSVVDEGVNQTVSNAQTTRDLSSVFADVNLLINTFYGNSVYLESESARLLDLTRALEDKKLNPDLDNSIHQFSEFLHSLLDKCEQTNELFLGVESKTKQILNIFTRLEEIISEEIVSQVLVGGDTAVMDQLSVRIANYRQTFLLVERDFLSLNHKSIGTRFNQSKSGDQSVINKLESYKLQLQTMTAFGPDVDYHREKLIQEFLIYSNLIHSYMNVLEELKIVIENISDATRNVMAEMEMMDKEIALASETIRKSIVSHFFTSGAVVLVLCVLLIVILAFMLTSFIRSNITKPMKKICSGIETFRKGDLQTAIELGRQDDWSIIEDSLNAMAFDIHSSIIKQKKTEDELKIAIDKAEEANRAKSRFLANMSHEIRTPLNAVTGFSELLTSMVEDEKQKSYLMAIKNAGKSLLTLINDILDLSKIEAGKFEIHHSPIHVRTILKEIEQIFSIQTSRKKVGLVTIIDDDFPDTLNFDEIRLRQILFNIIGNAVKFTDIGHIKITVETTDVRKDENICDILITVEDTGIGISEDDIETIFDSFKQQASQDSSKFGGSGLGLTICKRLVEMMSGQIYVQSIEGKGSVFKIQFMDVEVVQKDLPTIKDTFDHENVRFEKGKVLVVDDVESNRNLLFEILSKVNLEVLIAENGNEAILISTEYQPDLILMDLKMPLMNGFEAAKQLKANEKTKEIPVIAVTASSPSTNKVKIYEMGFNGFLSKPIKVDRLFKALSRYLNNTSPEISQNSPEKLITPYEQSSLKTMDPRDYRIVRHAIDSDLLVKWQKLLKRQPIKDVLTFGNNVMELGVDKKLDFLSDYGKRLIGYVDNYDIDKMRSAISEFEDLVQSFKTIHKEDSHDR